MAAKYWAFMFTMGAATYAEALAVVEQSRAHLAARADALPAVVRARVDLALAKAHLSFGDLRQAEPLMASSGAVLKEFWRQRRDCCAHHALIFYEGLLSMQLGQHAVADARFREGRELDERIGQDTNPSKVYDWAFIAMNQMMSGDLVQPQQVLEAAPKVGAMAGDPLSGNDYPLVVPAMLARLHLERGDVAGAVRLMPDVSALGPDAEPLFAEHALRGAILCAAGRASEGLPIMLVSIRSVSSRVGDQHPALARTRATAGLCALSLGDAALAERLADQARRAFTAQPKVSPYYKAPLAKLEQALQGRRPTT